MDVSKLATGDNPPDSINVIIEIPLRGDPVKYEFDKDTGFMFVDRMMNIPMHYPCNYGFVPNTLCDDGDAIDVMVVGDIPLIPGSVIKCRPIAVVIMEDEHGEDEKIIAVPTVKVSAQQAYIKTIEDLPGNIVAQVAHFFEHYKDLDSNKWTKIKGTEGTEVAKKLIMASIERFNRSK